MDKSIKCEKCENLITETDYISNYNVCPVCNKHYHLHSWQRIKMIADENSFEELGREISSCDFLEFKDTKPYSQRLNEARKKSDLTEAITVGSCAINGIRAAMGVMDFSFMGGSMGSVVGEKIKLLTDHAINKKLPLILFCASGGARMQEGIISLMQMAKTVSCINRLKQAALPYISVITNPTTGGVSASFASTADIIISEPESLFCFAGPRVVKQTIKKELPPDFGLAERNIRNGQVDMIIRRHELKEILFRIINILSKRENER